ncbi:hypothetical protein GH714_000291 [Hevea brasiliensis]|uniref:RNase H type-1 domain-containing protein n=1 Tax=Hevea brasiliensis TaxID=3981 RepID=A0A6A6L886_HEVBR|nr:hypothetical protein GH714_000291 [Hevea brasiliensis]
MECCVRNLFLVFVEMAQWLLGPKLCPSPTSWAKFNSDGSFILATNFASASRLIRSSSGAWVGGFAVNWVSCSFVIAELWGVYLRLQLAWEKGV